MVTVTFDEVLPTLLRTCEGWAALSSFSKLCCVRDLEGHVRLVLEPEPGSGVSEPLLIEIENLLSTALGQWFRPPILATSMAKERGALAREILKEATEWTDAAWLDAAGNRHQAAPGRWLRLERRLSKFDWLTTARGGAAWPLGTPKAPAIVTFYSFKGGVGRTTLLAACAWQLASEHNKKVAVVDLDLEAPGLGTLFGAQGERGVVDFIVDQIATGNAGLEPLPAHALGVQDAALIDVVPAGRLNLGYLEKLGRLDFAGSGGFLEEVAPPVDGALKAMLQRFRGAGYDFVLLDARAGLHDLAGLSLHGLAHVDVLVGRASEQGFAGLDLTVNALAHRRLPAEMMVVVAHSMVPSDEKDAVAEKRRFRERSYEIFKQHVYDQMEDEEIPQLEDSSAAHSPFPITRDRRLENIDDLGAVRPQLFASEYSEIVSRILELSTLAPEQEEES